MGDIVLPDIYQLSFPVLSFIASMLPSVLTTRVVEQGCKESNDPKFQWKRPMGSKQ
jgi:hypothetical protein